MKYHEWNYNYKVVVVDYDISSSMNYKMLFYQGYFRFRYIMHLRMVFTQQYKEQSHEKGGEGEENSTSKYVDEERSQERYQYLNGTDDQRLFASGQFTGTAGVEEDQGVENHHVDATQVLGQDYSKASCDGTKHSAISYQFQAKLIYRKNQIIITQ